MLPPTREGKTSAVMHAEQSGAGNQEERKAAFRRAVETIKARLPIEDIVRERLPTLQKRGPRWVACCPFTPSGVLSLRTSSSLPAASWNGRASSEPRCARGISTYAAE